MKEELLEKLRRATTDISVAQIRIEEVSNSNIGFDLSKPLNMLFKELDASRQLLLVYIGDKKFDEVYVEGVEPMSLRAYKNLNEED